MGERKTYGSYNDGCAAAHALDLIGDRWTMIIVRELLLAPKRFSDLQRDVMGIGPTILTRRLGDLVEAGIAVKTEVNGLPGEFYELTSWGYELERVNNALAEWAVASPSLPWEADMSPDTLVLTMRAHARPRPDLVTSPATVALHLTDSRRTAAGEVSTYLAHLTPGETTIVRDLIPGATTATLTATTRALKAVILGQAQYTPSTPDIITTGDTKPVQWLLAATQLSS
ncbi:winged helix-turn-helix transcriptional regulator [Kocuria tytonis]|uniref:Transcriptional regulator n=1 Tax=Kocuria tytonis TaxID=2054280 RepID=A0A495A5H9_9MICC|nr:helix-turn-helix domain-containing protein [Kocuria tytonis]RKQ35041.1 transcriptional regulator [Kocuria tytonis]